MKVKNGLFTIEWVTWHWQVVTGNIRQFELESLAPSQFAYAIVLAKSNSIFAGIGVCHREMLALKTVSKRGVGKYQDVSTKPYSWCNPPRTG